VVAAREIPGFRIEHLKVRPFHKAPKWNPARGISLSAVRVRPILQEQLKRMAEPSQKKNQIDPAETALKKDADSSAPLNQKLKRKLSKRNDMNSPEKAPTLSPKIGGL
jgi:hypothetical protein